MLNPIESYAEAGEKSARAYVHGDAATACFHKRWYSEARALETGADKDAAWDAAWDAARAAARDAARDAQSTEFLRAVTIAPYIHPVKVMEAFK